MGGRDPVYIGEITLYCVTDLAILIGPPDAHENEKTWIPVSQILSTDLPYDDDETAIGSEGYVEIPQWLAREKGLGGY